MMEIYHQDNRILSQNKILSHARARELEDNNKKKKTIKRSQLASSTKVAQRLVSSELEENVRTKHSVHRRRPNK